MRVWFWLFLRRRLGDLFGGRNRSYDVTDLGRKHPLYGWVVQKHIAAVDNRLRKRRDTDATT